MIKVENLNPLPGVGIVDLRLATVGLEGMF
jgi:hypothetical protein